MKLTTRKALLASSMISGLALIMAGPAAAADASGPVSTMAGANTAPAAAAGAPISTVTQGSDQAGGGAAQVQELVVTGSRIPRPNLTSISPIQSVNQQEFQLEGHTDAIDLLNNLPQNFQNNSVDFSNTSNPLSSPGGITTADLRGLGPQRTLVLVNGRRLGIGDANTGNPNPAPDLDQIPAAMIDHVEVVTGGASAAYGSDAVAGVVNFILKKNFEGIEIDGTLGGDQHSQHNSLMDGLMNAAKAGGLVSPITIPGDKWDGANEDASVIIGANSPDDKGNVTAYFEYHNQDPVRMSARDFSDCQLVATNALNSGSCTGSSNSNRLIPLSPAATVGDGTVVGHSILPWPQAGTSPPALFNANPYEYLSRGDTRYIAGYEAHYDINPAISLYSEFNFMNDRSLTEIAPSGMFLGGNPFDPQGAGGWLINCGNPYLSTQEAGAIGCAGASPTTMVDVFLGRRNVEGGPRISYYEHFNYRAVAGIRGDLGNSWHYDVYGSYYYTFLYQDNSNYVSNSRIGNALNVVNVNGVPTCESVINGSDLNCVPYNIFQTGGVTQAALNYLDISGTETGTVEEQILEGDLNGDLGKYGIKSPWADDSVKVALGFDYRHDHLDFIPDAVVGSGDLGGGAGVGSSINAGIGVEEGYGEMDIPIIQNVDFIKSLELDLNLRYSAYTTGPGPWTYRAGILWSPTSDIRFRAGYNRAIRAPNIIELYNPVIVTQSNSFGSQSDPCAGAAPVFTLAECERTGVTAAQYGHLVQCPAGQCDVSTGGNPALKPESADTYTVGATFTPHWVPGLNFSVDWWQIQQGGLIGTIGPQTVVDQCATIGQLCNLIHRSPATGFLFGPSSLTTGGYVVGSSINIAEALNSGIDFQGEYRLNLDDVGASGMGSLDFLLNGSYTLEASSQTPGSPKSDCAGLFGPECQNLYPRWRHTLRLTWNTPWNVLASLQWRYIGSMSLDENSPQPGLNAGAFDAFDAHLPAVNYLDLAAQWRVNTTLTVRGGINNILDQDPPLVNSFVSGIGTPNTYPTYDLLGRQLFVSATARF